MYKSVEEKIADGTIFNQGEPSPPSESVREAHDRIDKERAGKES